MLQVSSLLALLFTQGVAHIQQSKSPAVDLVSQVAAQLPSLAQVDLTGEVRKALIAARTSATPSPLRAP